jgi:YebC/PmpR family DNA-binding regulatory protein
MCYERPELAMSGHSKWSTIKHKKAQKDARRGKLFTKLIKEITVAARMGGSDINSNPRLRTAVITARQNSMPSDNIDRAIKKGTGELEGVTYDEITYEVYGPGGVAVLVQVVTDNKNRTVAEIRNVVQKHGGNVASAGAVAWMFAKRGLLAVERAGVDEDRVMEIALEAGADDVREAGDLLEILTAPDAFETVKAALEGAGITPASAEVTMMPSSTVSIEGKNAEQMVRLLEVLEDHDDVQSVASNMDIAAEELERLSA